MDFTDEPVTKKPRLDVTEHDDPVLAGMTASGVPILSGFSANTLLSTVSESSEEITVVYIISKHCSIYDLLSALFSWQLQIMKACRLGTATIYQLMKRFTACL